jgi:hypothetical protein
MGSDSAAGPHFLSDLLSDSAVGPQILSDLLSYSAFGPQIFVKMVSDGSVNYCFMSQNLHRGAQRPGWEGRRRRSRSAAPADGSEADP